MTHQDSDRIIGQWCESTGMQPWPSDEDVYVDLDGTIIGLFFDEAPGAGVLHVVADLAVDSDPGLADRLLALNVSTYAEDGWFGTNRDTGKPVWRLDIPLHPELDGRLLPERIAAGVRDAITRTAV